MKRLTLASLLSVFVLLPGLILAAAMPAVPHVPSGAMFVDSGQALGDATSSDVALGDLDGDGDLDAFVANAANAPDEVWLNQGGAQGGTPGVFVDSGQSLGNLFSMAVALGDLDNDGDLDAFAVADSSAGDSNQVWLNQGGAQGGSSGTFVGNGQTSGDDLVSAVALGDLDGDGDLDAFVTRSIGRADKVWWNDGTGMFSDSGQNLGADYSNDVALGDLDGDGDRDAFVATGGASKVWINQGGDQTGTAGEFADSGQSLGDGLALAVALADLDGDGDLDAFVGDSSADRVWLNQGGVQGGVAGQFVDSGQSLGTGQSRDVALADLDADSAALPDVFVAKGGANQVWLNSGAAVFMDSGQQLGDAFSEGVALGDVDGDADQDVFVANWDAPNEVWLNQSAAPPQDEADLSVTVLGQTYVEASPFFAPATFNVTVRNLGPAPATGVTARGSFNSFVFSDGSQGECASLLCDAWLFGDLAPGQSATVYYGPIYGRRFSNGQQVIHSEARAILFVTGVETDPDPTNNRDDFTTYFYDCDLLVVSCWLERTFCEARDPSLLFAGPTGMDHSSGVSSNVAQTEQLTAWSGHASAGGLLRPLGEVVVDLAVYYLVRDDVLKETADGYHYIDLYETHDSEIRALLDADAALEAEGIATLQLWEPNLWALVVGQGDSATITAEQVTAIDNFLTNLAAVAGPELQQVISEERARLGPPEEYVGMTMDEARGIIVGYGARLPVVQGE